MENLTGRTLLDRYFLRELVGSGGMADVYLAWDQLRNAKMAVKILRRDLGGNQLFFERFSTEANILRQLEHPNIVRLFEFQKEGEIAFFVMQWVEGSNLKQLINRSHQIVPLSDCFNIFSSICSALNYAHENQIFHCDIKPANIMLDVKGNTFDALLADFGVAQLADNFGSGGTPTYMAPEQFTGGKIDARTDVYALGITLYEILSGGHTPFKGTSPQGEGSTMKERVAWEHLYSNPPSLRKININCSHEMEEVVFTAMQKNPQRRFPNAMSFLYAFEYARSTMPNYFNVIDNNRRIIVSQVGFQDPSAASGINSDPNTTLSRSKSSRDNDVSSFRSTNHRFGSHLFTGLTVYGRNLVIFGRTGNYAGTRFQIPMGETTIGRGSQANLKISDTTVSRQHATIIRTSRGVYIRDNSSTWGTFVNGRQIFNPTLLKVGDVIQFGSQLIFEYTKG